MNHFQYLPEFTHSQVYLGTVSQGKLQHLNGGCESFKMKWCRLALHTSIARGAELQST